MKNRRKNVEQVREEKINRVVKTGQGKFMNEARKNPNDEFYTKYETIEKEIAHHKKLLKGKVILMNCDDPE